MNRPSRHPFVQPRPNTKTPADGSRWSASRSRRCRIAEPCLTSIPALDPECWASANPWSVLAKRSLSSDLRPSDTNRIYCRDALEGLKELPDESVDCVITSPPYWALRDYGNPPARRDDGTNCALGLEESLQDYVRHLCEVFHHVHRVLEPSGTCWVNLGDTYHNATKWTCKDEVSQTICRGNNRDFKTSRRINQGLPEKCLAQIPARFAIEMTARGWILRNDIVWHTGMCSGLFGAAFI